MYGKYKVVLSSRSDKMLVSHTEFLARVSSSAARKLLADFRAASSSVSEDPFRYPYADEQDAEGIPPDTYRKCLFYDRYKSLFLIEANTVYIDAIVDCRQENSGLYK